MFKSKSIDNAWTVLVWVTSCNKSVAVHVKFARQTRCLQGNKRCQEAKLQIRNYSLCGLITVFDWNPCVKQNGPFCWPKWANLQTKFAQIADQIRLFCFAISPKLENKIAHFSLQNRPFCLPIWAILHCERTWNEKQIIHYTFTDIHVICLWT
mgnify:CR=1 FL=1